MKNIYRLIVSNYGEEESMEVNGKILFINCPFKNSLKIFSFPRWRFRKRKYLSLIRTYKITCVDWLEYSLQNVFFYLFLKNIEKYDTLCFELAGFDFSTVSKAKQFLLELAPQIGDKKVLIVVKKDSFEENNILLEFPICNSSENGNALKLPSTLHN